jgi:hypothetical protein
MLRDAKWRARYAIDRGAEGFALSPNAKNTQPVYCVTPRRSPTGVRRRTGDFSEALAALLGPEAPGLSPTTMARLKTCWEEEYKAWQARSLAGTPRGGMGASNIPRVRRLLSSLKHNFWLYLGPRECFPKMCIAMFS